MSMKKIELTCTKPDKVLNIVSTEVEGMSYSLANKILRKKDIRINNEKILENVGVAFGDLITVFAPDDFSEKTITETNFFETAY